MPKFRVVMNKVANAWKRRRQERAQRKLKGRGEPNEVQEMLDNSEGSWMYWADRNNHQAL